MIRDQATAWLLALTDDRLRDAESVRLAARALELVRDVGVEFPGNSHELVNVATATVATYARSGDYLRLGDALLHCGSLYLLLGEERQAAPVFRQAVHVLRAARQHAPHDPHTLHVLHRALALDLHWSWYFFGSRLAQERQLREFLCLAEEINTPIVTLVTLREHVGYHRRRDDLHAADDTLHDLRTFRASVQSVPICTDQTLVLAEVEQAFSTGKHDWAIELLRTRLLPLYEANRQRCPTEQRLGEWSQEHRLLAPSPLAPIYLTPLLIELPRHEETLLTHVVRVSRSTRRIEAAEGVELK